MEGAGVRLRGPADAHQHVLLIILMAVPAPALPLTLIQGNTVQVEHQGTSATRLTGSAIRVPVVHDVLLSHEERSHTHLRPFLVLASGIVRGKVSHLRDRVNEVPSACLLALRDGEYDPCSPRCSATMM